jgi:hypothetical protein
VTVAGGRVNAAIAKIRDIPRVASRKGAFTKAENAIATVIMKAMPPYLSFAFQFRMAK